MGREENIIVFKDTENIYKKNARIKESVEKCRQNLKKYTKIIEKS